MTKCLAMVVLLAGCFAPAEDGYIPPDEDPAVPTLPPAQSCDAIPLPGTLPVDVAGSTVNAGVGVNCEFGVASPVVNYHWVAPDTGTYAVSVSGPHAMTVEIQRGDCNDPQLACAISDQVSAIRFDTFNFAVSSVDGIGAPFDLRIERVQDVCGDGVCNGFESSTTCPQDCMETANTCGNSVCDAGETAGSCPVDCDGPPTCGDGVCSLNETCPADCTTSAPVCGDGVCEAGELCPLDCNRSTATCGDGVCEAGEACSLDCDTGTTGGDTGGSRTGGGDTGGGDTGGRTGGGDDGGYTGGGDDGGYTGGGDDGGDDGGYTGGGDDGGGDDGGFGGGDDGGFGGDRLRKHPNRPRTTTSSTLASH